MFELIKITLFLRLICLLCYSIPTGGPIPQNAGGKVNGADPKLPPSGPPPMQQRAPRHSHGGPPPFVGAVHSGPVQHVDGPPQMQQMSHPGPMPDGHMGGAPVVMATVVLGQPPVASLPMMPSANSRHRGEPRRQDEVQVYVVRKRDST
jgi:hypothetical protein